LTGSPDSVGTLANAKPPMVEVNRKVAAGYTKSVFVAMSRVLFRFKRLAQCCLKSVHVSCNAP